MRKVFFLAIIAAALATAAEPTARQILERTVDRSKVFQDACMRVRIEKTKKSGRKKTIELTVFQKNYPEITNVLARVESPEEAKGISFLTWDYKDPERQDERYYYLPALKDYQQLSSDQGSDYEEKFGFSMDIFAIDLDAADHRLLGDEVIDGAPCYKVESLMKELDSPQGAKVVTWVRKDNWLAVRLKAYDRQDVLIRDFELTGMERFGDVWQETEGRYSDLVKGRAIEFKIMQPKFNTGLADEIFLKSFNPEEAKAP